jgi:hypothetical protein
MNSGYRDFRSAVPWAEGTLHTEGRTW